MLVALQNARTRKCSIFLIVGLRDLRRLQIWYLGKFLKDEEICKDGDVMNRIKDENEAGKWRMSFRKKNAHKQRLKNIPKANCHD